MKASQNQHVTGAGEAGEETLRVIANLPPPEGLADRVQTRLRTAPRTAGVFNWPMVFAPGGWGHEQAFRGAAAAAIVCVVAGGCWRIYSRVQPAHSARVIVMPTPASPARGFSTAGGAHTPDPGPVVTQQVVPEAVRPGAPQGVLVTKDGADEPKKPAKVRKTAPPATYSPADH